MRWQNKALALRIVAGLPFGREPVHYLLQSLAGGLRKEPDPRTSFSEFAELMAFLGSHGYSPAGAQVLEVGTGRGLEMPMAFFLSGAASVTSFDLHRYLRPDRVAAALEAVRRHRATLREILRPIAAGVELDRRLETLCRINTLEELRDRCRIAYRAPADASATGMAPGSVDIHFSYTVFEHIPENALRSILSEASRLLSARGVALHHIDCSDHFAQRDSAISRANFLRFSDAQWEHIAGNQYAYHNRLRISDYRKIFSGSGLRIVAEHTLCDARSLREIRAGFPLDRRFRGYPAEELATDIAAFLAVAASGDLRTDSWASSPVGGGRPSHGAG